MSGTIWNVTARCEQFVLLALEIGCRTAAGAGDLVAHRPNADAVLGQVPVDRAARNSGWVGDLPGGARATRRRR